MADDGGSNPPADGSPGETLEICPDERKEQVASEMDNLVPSRGYHTLPIVGLGGSAGGISALETFLSRTPVDTGFAFVVIIHLSPEHESTLAAVLQRYTAMPVLQLTERTAVKPNTVYVIPPSKQLAMLDGEIVLRDLSRAPGKRVAVDLFFRSLADTHGPHAAAVVFSGSDSDGAIGIKWIKERGGLTIVQDPNEAEYDGMPRASIATGMVDWVLPAADIPARLVAYRRNEGLLKLPPEEEPKAPEPKEATDGEGALREVLAFLRMRTGYDFAYYKRATILRRIARRMQVNDMIDLPSYLDFIRTHQGETGALLQDLLISVTNFFRDRDSFAALEREIPRLFENKKSSDQVRVWVPACATGEEAYSIAMLLREHASTLDSPPQIQVFATDIDENAINAARGASYPETIVADVSDERLRRFFTKEHGGYRVKRSLRETVLFALHDLLKDSPFSRLDLVSCRNLLIYLNHDAQRRTLEIFHFALRNEGRLFLGSSESIEEGGTLFSLRDKKHRVYVRRPTPRSTLPVPVGGVTTLTRALHARQRAAATPVIPRPSQVAAEPAPLAAVPASLVDRQISWSELHFRMIEKIAPPSIVVDQHYDIVHLSEHAGRFLEMAGGEPSMNLLRIVNPMLRLDLRSALFRAAQSDETVELEGVTVELEGQARRLDISVRPARVGAESAAPDYFLIILREQNVPEPGAGAVVLPPDAVATHLEKELEQVKVQLRDTVEQYEAGTEELKASNEELQAMNEELRSATEELETGREELQSINEELTTVNQELKGKIGEVSRANNDLQNLMSSTNIATVFLDRDLRIKRYTPTAVALFNLIPSDIGRPLSDLTPRLDYASLAEDAARVLAHLAVIERETRSSDGSWFLARVLPYRTSEDQISGVVLTFVNITERKEAEAALRGSEKRLNAIVSQSAAGIVRWDLDGRLTFVNQKFCRLLGYAEGELLGRTLQEFALPEGEEEAARWEQLLAKRTSFDMEKRLRRKDGSELWAHVCVTIGSDGEGEALSMLGAVIDITTRKEVESALQAALRENKTARAEVEEAARAKDHFLAVLSHELRTPLTPIIMTVGALSRRDDLSSRMREGLEMIQRNVEIESRFIDDLLDLTRITRNSFEIVRAPTDVHEVVRRAIEISDGDIVARKQRLAVSLEARRQRVDGDSTRLQQVIWNLLKNSSKFTPAGGDIRIVSRNEKGRIVVSVTDSGIGIEPDLLAHVFDPFIQGSDDMAREYGGLGLGLAISKAIVEAHGGSLRAESAGRGKGATMIVTLPVVP